MLDLTTIRTDRTYELKLINGDILHITRPTQGMMDFVMDYKKNESKDYKEVYNLLCGLFLRIVNLNTDGKTYTIDEFMDYHIKLFTITITDYFNFWNKEIEEIVDFQQSQQG